MAQGDAQAQLLLGMMYAKGQGVKKDPARAMVLLEKAAKQGQNQAKEMMKNLK